MDELKEIYDKHYLGSYRKKLVGYEIARWVSLEHFITKVLQIGKISNVLDYGAGRGLHVELWRQIFPGANLYFCDLSLVALQQLVDKNPEFKLNCRVVKNNQASFNSSFFDVIVSVEVMEHVENLDAYLSDIFRLLKPGGYFIWTTPCANRFSIEHIYSIATNQIEKTSEGYRRWRWEHPTHLRRLKSNEIKRRLQDIGFEKIGFRFRAHFFSFVCTYLFSNSLQKTLGERMMLLDYYLFRRLPNGASMIGYARKMIRTYTKYNTKST